MTNPSLIFIAGIPASGKSHFGRWLAARHGYLHVDAELPNELEQAGLRRLWNEAVRSGGCSALGDELRRRGQPVVFDWGFPVKRISLAAALKRAGFASWWFDADLQAARRAHGTSGKSLTAFDAQVAAIASSISQVASLFAPNILRTVGPRGGRMPARDIYARIRGAE